MENYKKRLYDVYVSSGHACADGNDVFGCDAAMYEWLIKKFMPKNRDVSVLDMPCGNGLMLLSLKKMGYNNVKGVDISKEQLDLAAKRGADNLVCSEIGEFLRTTQETFDIIFLVNILEHMGKEEVFSIMDSVNKRLNKGGKVIIVVPNGSGLFGMYVKHGDFTHETCFSENSIRQVLYATGFNDIRAFEIPPIIHGVISFVRYIIWHTLSLVPRLLLIAESGILKHRITQNIAVTAQK